MTVRGGGVLPIGNLLRADMTPTLPDVDNRSLSATEAQRSTSSYSLGLGQMSWTVHISVVGFTPNDMPTRSTIVMRSDVELDLPALEFVAFACQAIVFRGISMRRCQINLAN
jgi:hypothetical protein